MKPMIAAVIILIGLAMVFTTAISKEDVPPFVGAWEATDFDDSNMWMWIEPGLKNIHRVISYDDRTSIICYAGAPAIITSSGLQVDSFVLSTQDTIVYCIEDNTRYAATLGGETYTYNPVDDVLCSQPGEYQVCWHRSNDKKPDQVILGY